MFKSTLLSCKKKFPHLSLVHIFPLALSLFLNVVFSVYCAGSSVMTQNLEMHDQISLIELLHQYCTRFKLTKITLALTNRKIKASISNSRFHLSSRKRNSYVHVNITVSFSTWVQEFSHY